MLKKIVFGLLISTIMIFAQTHSNVAPEMFSQHQGSTYFATAIINEGDSLYTYQFVPIESISESDMLSALLSDFENRTDGDITFQQYRARSVERVNYALYGTVDTSKAVACGFVDGITESQMKALLGVIDHR